MISRANAIRHYLSIRHRTVATSLLRVLLGLNMLVLYVMHFPERDFIWGDHGVLPLASAKVIYATGHRWSLYYLSPSPLAHAALFWAGFIVTVLFVVGIAPRLMSVLFFIASWSLYARNPLLMDGGDNILILMSFLLIFVDTSGRFAPWRAAAEPRQNPFVALVHNVGVAALIGQLFILYFTSAWAKMSGHMWQDGTAIYYILRSTSFDVSPTNAIITHNPYLETMLTYATILLQIGFPFAVWSRYLKWPWLVGALFFHLGIGFSMGLMWFSLVMISCESMLIDDRTYAALRERLRGFAARFVPIARGSMRRLIVRVRPSLTPR